MLIASMKIAGIERAAPINPRMQMIVMATGRSSVAAVSFIIGWNYFLWSQAADIEREKNQPKRIAGERAKH